MPRAACWLCFAAIALLSFRSVSAQPPDRFVPKLSEMEQKSETALAKKVKLAYRDQPLAEVIADLSKQLDLPITLDPEGLDEAGVTGDQRVSLEASAFSARTAFEVLLGPLHLDWVPEESGIAVTSAERCEERQFVRVYPVGDLIPEGDLESETLNDLSETITVYVAPDSWTTNGGTGTLSAFGQSLVVRQSYPIHREVTELISGLWKLRKNKEAIVPIPSNGEADEVRSALDARHSLSGDFTVETFVKRIGELAKVEILLDPEGLDEAGVTIEDTLRVNYRNASLFDILNKELEHRHLKFVVHEEFIQVTSYEHQREHSYHRIYPLGDLIGLKQPDAEDFDDLISTIIAATGPNDWSENGGQAMASAWLEPPALIVTTTDGAHREIEQLLAALRASGVAEFNAELRKREEKIVERIYPLYLHRRLASPQPPAEGKPAEKKDEPREPLPTADEVAKLLAELLPDASWKDEGVLLRPFHDRLIIRQRGPMHRKIEKALQKIDAWHPGGLGGVKNEAGGFGGGGFF